MTGGTVERRLHALSHSGGRTGSHSRSFANF